MENTLQEDLACFVPEQDFVLEEGWFSHNLRKVRRGAAPGPSGMTADHLRPLLDVSSTLFSPVLASIGAT